MSPLQNFTVIHTQFCIGMIFRLTLTSGSLGSSLWGRQTLWYCWQNMLSQLAMYPKMHNQMHNKKVSRPYYKSLHRISLSSIVFRPPQVSVQTLEAKNNDEMLLRYLHGLITANSKELGTTFPNLKGQATLVNSWMDGRLAKDPKEVYTLYTATMYKEFHELLCVLLEEFEKTLQKLMKIRQKAVIPSQGSAKFRKLINSTCLYGYALQRIVNGSAIKQHLQNIEYSLQDHHWAEMDQERQTLTSTFWWICQLIPT